MEAIKNYLVSLIRTAVPIIVGSIVAFLATRDIVLDAHALAMLTLFVQGVAGIGYYLVVRGLEHVNARFGWLLGYANMPTYVVLPNGQSPTIGGDPVMAPPSVPTASVPEGTGVQSK